MSMQPRPVLDLVQFDHAAASALVARYRAALTMLGEVEVHRSRATETAMTSWTGRFGAEFVDRRDTCRSDARMLMDLIERSIAQVESRAAAADEENVLRRRRHAAAMERWERDQQHQRAEATAR
jgi:hypothetical protein